LTQISPFGRIGVPGVQVRKLYVSYGRYEDKRETIRHGAICTIDNAGTSWVLDTRDRLFIRIDGLWKESLVPMTSGCAIKLADISGFSNQFDATGSVTYLVSL
jgi:hypothetical protein